MSGNLIILQYTVVVGVILTMATTEGGFYAVAFLRELAKPPILALLGAHSCSIL